jgi:hypothetical protein
LQETVRILKERACAAFGVESDKVEIWDYFNHGKYANLDKELDKDLEAARILDQQPILLDDKVGGRGSVGVCWGRWLRRSLVGDLCARLWSHKDGGQHIS